MRILICSLNFAPELTGIGRYSGEMAEWLVSKGHEVRVLAAPPYYPEWRVRKGYSGCRFRRERVASVDVLRCPLWVPQKPSGLKRVIHLASFALSSGLAMLCQIRWRPDVVWVVEPALLTAPASLLMARMSGAHSWLHIQDFEVDAAFEMGFLKSHKARSLVAACERWLLSKFDTVSTISGRMLERAASKGVHGSRLVSFVNWVDLSTIKPLAIESPYRTELLIPRDAVVALYSGNMGTKQGLDLLAEVAGLLASERDIVLVFCGDGAGKPELVARCGTSENVRILPLQPADRLNDLLGMADIHLLPQRADAADLVLPSKLTGMLASGRCVVVAAAAHTELGQVVAHSGCGLLVPPEDPKAFADAILKLAANPERRKSMGRAARSYAELRMDATAVLDDFEGQLIRRTSK